MSWTLLISAGSSAVGTELLETRAETISAASSTVLGILIGKGNERLLRRSHLAQQPNWIQSGAQCFHTAAHRLRRARVRQKPLAGRRWRMVALADPCPLALLPGQLERGLEDVHEQPHRRVEPGQSRRGRQPLQASIAHDAADHGAVLLLDEGLVVFLR